VQTRGLPRLRDEISGGRVPGGEGSAEIEREEKERGVREGDGVGKRGRFGEDEIGAIEGQDGREGVGERRNVNVDKRFVRDRVSAADNGGGGVIKGIKDWTVGGMEGDEVFVGGGGTGGNRW
jgi:hypothetical protein